MNGHFQCPLACLKGANKRLMHRSNYRLVLNKKRKGEPVRTAVKQRDTGNVVNVMDALRRA
jgi:hypothetical protein